MLEPRIQQHFFDSADLHYQAAEALAHPLEAAAQALVNALTGGARVLVCGQGSAAALADLAVSYFNGQFERDRPGLAAWALRLQGAGALRTGADAPSQAAHQVHTLGQPGDLLLLLAADGAHDALLAAALAAARVKDMTVVALLGAQSAALAKGLRDTDVAVLVPHERRARVLETLLLALHCLCDAVDQQLLGDEEPV